MENLDVTPITQESPVSWDRQLGTADADALNAWLEKGEAFLVDIREPHEFEEERIAGAFLIPMSRFNPDTFPRLPDLKTVLVSRNGHRAVAVAEMLSEADFEGVHVLEGGMDAWTDAGYELEE